MYLFDGLRLYEIVLLILGTLLFLVLLVLLIVAIVRNRSVKAFILLFPISIVMIGFPAITKIKFDRDGVEIDKITKELVENPSNTELKTKLETLVQKVRPRASESQDGLVKIARAEAVLGDQEKAVKTLDQALTSNPQLEVAKDLKMRLNAVPASNDARIREAVTANLAAARK